MVAKPYKPSDYSRVKSWWEHAKETAPTQDMLPPETTFFIEHEGKDLVCFTLYKTNCKRVLWIEALIGNPEFEGPLRKRAIQHLVIFSKKFGQVNGYTHLFCMAPNKELEHYYQANFGFTKTIDVACMTQRI